MTLTTSSVELRSLAAAHARLLEQFESVITPETIHETLRRAVDELERDAHFVTFIPLLAERRALERLRALAPR